MVLSIFIVKVDRPITCFYVCVLYVLYDSWVSTDLSVSIKTTTTLFRSLIQPLWNWIYFFIENINICLNFLSFGCKTKQEAEICRRERQRPVITHSQFNGCGWPGDAIDLVLPKYFQEYGDVSLHFASSPSEVSWGCKFVDGMPNLQETLCYKLDDVSASPMRNRHLISNTKHVVR